MNEKKGRIASIDYGTKRIGLAISDEMKIIARSLGVVEATKKMQESVKRVVTTLAPYALEAIVVGLPLHLNGRAGYLADEVRSFIELLSKEVSCPIIAWEERLSTKQAESTLREAGLSRKKRVNLIDGVTAVILLQNHLDYLIFSRNRS